MIATAATLAGARRLYVVAGLSSFLAMLANVVDIVLGVGGEMVTYGARPVAEWFDVRWAQKRRQTPTFTGSHRDAFVAGSR